ncbi:GPALPP motifs-containing protein 1 isoform X2 [Sphaerodactylus townsendi]|uniref:GPALPP motifs-containing protein 1 isoform X2 n=1 Tax=Sphaerodactylus townsendi TaxID=933632 RepID=UPI002027274C|nr:GPALPP motifs-containing protein 1 isoform X2 [Sphaerodactylus townsendi]
MAARDVIGPALPPGFPRSASPDDTNQGPALPPDYSSNLKGRGCDEDSTSPCVPRETDTDSEDDRNRSHVARKQRRLQEDDGFFGPALPPGFKRQDDSPERPVIGPALPPDFKKPSGQDEINRSAKGSFVPSPLTSQDSDSSGDEEAIIGPVPAKGPAESSVAAEFECRARRMKEKLLGHDSNESKQVKRESWMTELPPELKGFGLGARTFRRKADDKSGDRSVWTDTPADREKKAKEMQDGKKSASQGDGAVVVSERDKKLAEQVSLHNDSQRSESLMEIHHKKLKRKAAEEKDKPQERRPFDRDQDLQVHRFDEAQKRALIKQSRDLNTRFSHSKCNMFL